jgi:hypothetical protein
MRYHLAMKAPNRFFHPLTDSESEELEAPSIDSELAEYNL